VKRITSESSPPTNRKRRKDEETGDNVIVNSQVEKPDIKAKSSKKVAKESVPKVETAIDAKEPWTVWCTKNLNRSGWHTIPKLCGQSHLPMGRKW